MICYFTLILVVRPISIDFSQRIEMPNKTACGVTKLRNEFYIVCQLPPSDQYVIRIFEDRTPFRRQPKDIDIKEINSIWDIRSSEQENCLYICDYNEKCVWKIIREANEEHKVVKWLIAEYRPWSLSVSCDGQLLMVDNASTCLMIYG